MIEIDTQPFEPAAWFWHVADGPSGMAWSSAATAYVDVASADPARSTRIASEAELADVLRRYGLRGPLVTADDVRAEASRRMQALVGARSAAHLDMIVANGTREAVRLLRFKAERPWTAEEAARAAELEQLEAAIEAIRAASNLMEPAPPADYADDSHWPGGS